MTGKCLMKYRRFEEKYMFKKSWKVCIYDSLRDPSFSSTTKVDRQILVSLFSVCRSTKSYLSSGFASVSQWYGIA